MREGRGVSEPPFRLVGRHRPEEDNDTPLSVRIAFAVPKRHLPRAVDRNRVRRVMREAWRLDRAPWIEQLAAQGVRCDWLLVFQGSRPIPFDQARRKMAALFQRWMNSTAPSPPRP